MKIAGIYFSGTGNTKWVAEEFESKLSNKDHEVSIIRPGMGVVITSIIVHLFIEFFLSTCFRTVE